MNSCSEYVSSGHSDKTADLIASYLLDEYIKHDPKTRFALEVQLKDQVCNLAGEVTSKWQPSTEEISDLVKDAIREVGYTAEYAAKWPNGATLNADKVVVNSFIGQQSPNIAQGVDKEGWGDQGVFCGMATTNGVKANYGYMPKDRYFAHEIGKRLYYSAMVGEAPIGLDIKVLVSTTQGLNVEQVVVAAPMTKDNEDVARSFVADIVHDVLKAHSHTCDELIINGTGSFVIHSSVGDAGVVGRKLAVDFYGLNCPIGGGATFGKDATKADVTLNLAARYFALKELLAKPDLRTVYCKISCCIGQSKCLISYSDYTHNVYKQEEKILGPSDLIHKFRLDGSYRPDMFFWLCRDGLFSYVDWLARDGDAESNVLHITKE